MTRDESNGGKGPGQDPELDPEELIEPAAAPGSVVVDWEAELTPTPAAARARAPLRDTQPGLAPPPHEEPADGEPVFQSLVDEAAAAEADDEIDAAVEAAQEAELPDAAPLETETPDAAPLDAEAPIAATSAAPPPPPEEEVTDPSRPRQRPAPRMVVAVASGKGGVGKSLLAASISIYLAQLGKKVALVDAALSSPNLHTLVGLDEPERSLHSFLRGEVEHLSEVLEETPFPGLQLIPGHLNGYASANARPTQKNLLLSQIHALPAEFVVLDLDAGTSFNVIDLFLVADLHVVVTHPEPPSIESTFRMIKSAFVRKAAGLPGLKELLAELRPQAHAGLPTPNQLLRRAREVNPPLAEALHHAMASFKPRLVVNKTRTRDDLELGPALTVAGRRHVGLPLDYLGYVENDDLAWVTVRKRRALMVEYPEAKVCKDLERVVRRIISLESKERPECMRVPKSLAEQNHYEILGLHAHSTGEEVRRAQRRIRTIYGHDSRAIFGVAPPEEVEAMHRRIELAYTTLVDPEKRHLYNQELFPGGKGIDDAEEVAQGAEAAVTEGTIEPAMPPPLEDLPDMPPLAPDTEFTGDLLRQVREALGMERGDLSNRTKIQISHLRAIEEEDFSATPAKVYLRGWVKNIARELRLNPEQVAATYMERYEARVE